MELYPINIVRLQILESGQFINRFIQNYENSGINPDEDAIIKSEVADLKLQMVTYTKALRQIKARAESAALTLLDINRRRRFAVVKRAHSIYEYDENDLVSEAYQRINVILRKYKKTPFQNYETKSLSIKNFIIEVRSAKNNAMVTLNLTTVIDTLETANLAFNTMFNNRSSKNASAEKYNTNALRMTIFDSYRKLASYIHLMANHKKTPFYITTLEVLNNGRSYFADIIAHRKGVLEKRKLQKKKLEIVADLEENFDAE
ncbi:DUF6261 family protein [Flavobacterium sp. SM2513]|uniref:DUF6261 family protein n=1 Tax=Flavobacterium sp. SM2513 TaxID=3424766 RepID=UPI003D7FC1B6